MGITHGNRDARNASIGELDRKLISYLRLTHGAAKFEAISLAGGQEAGLQSSPRTNDDRTAVVLGAIPRRHAARSVARNLRLGAIGIQQTHAEVRLCSGQYPFHTAGAIMPIAYTSAERINIAGRVGKIDDQKIIAASCRLNERNTRHVSRARRLCFWPWSSPAEAASLFSPAFPAEKDRPRL